MSVFLHVMSFELLAMLLCLCVITALYHSWWPLRIVALLVAQIIVAVGFTLAASLMV